MTFDTMSRARVLLIGQRTSWGGSLIATLEEAGCAISFVRALEDSVAVIEREEFDLILAGSECRHLMHLLPSLAGSATSVYYVFPVENSCWWVPALRCGVDCYGSDALRPAEFAAQLRKILHRYSGERMKAAS